MAKPHTPIKLPATFRSLTLLRALNVAAMGLSLAAVTSVAFGFMLGHGTNFGSFGIIAGVPTLLVGTIWAIVLRVRTSVGRSRLRWGWLASIPLAIANGAMAGGLLLASERPSELLARLLGGALAGATFGVLFWLPGLVATLAVFGVPVAWSQKLARKGLAGEERGESIVGLTSLVLALIGLLGALQGHRSPLGNSLEMAGFVLMFVFAVAGIASGACATALAKVREARRRRFVSDVEEGKVAGFRVDAAPEGKVLVRVTSVGEGYRVANFEDEVATLDEHGEAIQELPTARALEWQGSGENVAKEVALVSFDEGTSRHCGTRRRDWGTDGDNHRRLSPLPRRRNRLRR